MPATPERSYYEILGVARTATTEEIKKKYRELARKHHPDVNPGNANAAQTFSKVTEAYKTLADPDNRATYDADQAMRERQANRANSNSSARNYSPPPGGVYNAPPPRPAAGANNAGASRAAEAARLVAEAKAAFQRGKFLEARTRAEQVIRLTSRNAEAYEILGDVYRIQGKNEQAMTMYSMCLQINPRNYAVMQRLERVAKDAGGPGSPTAQGVFFDNRDTPPSQREPSYRSSYGGGVAGLPEEKRSIAQLLFGFVGYAGVFIMILFVALFPGEAPRGKPLLSLVSTWNETVLLILALSGALLGATMTITGAIRRIDDELILGGSSRGGRSFVPMGLIMVILSVFSFYLAAVIYTAYSASQDALTASMKRVFVAVLAVVGALAAVYAPGHLQVLLWGGNIVFIAFVIGWLLGDFFRAD